MLTIEEFKTYYDPKQADSSDDDNLQFFIKSNMKNIFIKINLYQSVLDELKEERVNWARPGGADGPTFLIAIFSKNSHSAEESVVMTKAELISIMTKDFQHDIQDMNKVFLHKEKEITFSREDNPDVLFHFF